MRNKIGRSYKQKLTWCLVAIFAIFTTGLVAIQLHEDKKIKNIAMASRLDAMADILIKSALSDTDIEEQFPQELRYTIMNMAGEVWEESENVGMNNHLNRPEVQEALRKGKSWTTRRSETTGLTYFYFAKVVGDNIVRIAHPYDSSLRHFFRIDNIAVLLIFLLFLAAVRMLVVASEHFGKNVTNLLKLHIQNSEKGVAVFSKGRSLEYWNSKFKQYFTTIRGEAERDFSGLWSDESFRPLTEYLNNVESENITDQFSYEIERSGKVFRIKMLIYPDRSFEIGIVDVTAVQENTKLKQEMTSSISHELRTPVTSIQAYLETLVQNPEMDASRREAFIRRAYTQSGRLSELIRDVSLLTKIEETSQNMPMENVDLSDIVEETLEEMSSLITKVDAVIENELDKGLFINGNPTLLHSIFRNLLENSLKYAGTGINIHIECYDQHDGLLYLTYYDTGKGVPEEHLARLFERFYRISEGRTRDDGGSGLGLAIVKNAIIFHNGDITATNREGGGLQFFFTLHCI